jgi:hypothetical protein
MCVRIDVIQNISAEYILSSYITYKKKVVVCSLNLLFIYQLLAELCRKNHGLIPHNYDRKEAKIT